MSNEQAVALRKQALREVCNRLGVDMNLVWLNQALTHPSMCERFPKLVSYEKWETLGDSVMNTAIMDLLFEAIENNKSISNHKGLLSIAKAKLIANTVWVEVLEPKLGLLKLLLIVPDIKLDQHDRGSVVEAVFGVIYKCSSFGVCKTILRMLLGDLIPQTISMVMNNPIEPGTLNNTPRNAMQEWFQRNKLPIPQPIDGEMIINGDGSKCFQIIFEAKIDNKLVSSYGIARCKKDAIQRASFELMKKIDFLGRHQQREVVDDIVSL